MDFIKSEVPASFQYIPWWLLLNVLLEKRNFPKSSKAANGKSKLYTKSTPISGFEPL